MIIKMRLSKGCLSIRPFMPILIITSNLAHPTAVNFVFVSMRTLTQGAQKTLLEVEALSSVSINILTYFKVYLFHLLVKLLA